MNRQNREQHEQAALDAYAKAVGRLVRVPYLCGYEGSDSIDLEADPQVIVRIDTTPDRDVLHWNHEWLDPYWDATYVSGGSERHRNLRSTWIDGPSINSATGVTEWRGEFVTGCADCGAPLSKNRNGDMVCFNVDCFLFNNL